MLKALLLYALIPFPLLSIGQVSLKSLTVNHPDSNVVFIGIDNYLEVGAADSVRDIQLSSSKASASVSKISNTKFLVRVSVLGPTAFEVYDYSTSPEKLLLSKTFTAQVLPSPEARMGLTTDSLLSILSIVANPTLQVTLPNSSYQHNFTITSFQLTIMNANGDVIHTFSPSTGNRLTNEQISVINNLSKGDKLLFTQLVAGCPNCRSFSLSPYSITIK